ncbi:flagellar brake domain-containing protein [Deferribacterales bacterium Es71-Z0220]|jgi:c-di-GMP-binding flagellar brake protein YcgR|uniref:flagellar brake protein n=1 Tax=Deferrivibrio essentukiensis TaxID=2880922 RepID=UPI001F618032|nr:flagellar brake domain-containing protein [Deferrivibrio essentukiensis]MBZ4672677.1 pilZ [Deferribacteraceae bacterium]MCB4204437.1 flagellar brake domain-containing protein [Deferrivibrio essentukiensis]
MEKIKDISTYLTINTKILVNVLSGNYRGIYDSRIEDIHNDKMKITIPSQKGIPFPLSPGSKLEVSFITPMGRFSFNSEVIGRTRENIPLLEIVYPEFLRRQELRRFFRVEARLKIKFRTIDYIEKDGAPEMIKKEYDGIIKDISGGGIRLTSDIQLEQGQAIELDMSEAIGTKFDIIARVVHIYNNDDKSEVGVEFITIKETDRDKIIKYVFQRQIELKRMSK